MLIKKRQYFLAHQNQYQIVYQYNFLLRNRLEIDQAIIPSSQFTNLLSFYQNQAPPFINSYLKKLFWQNASSNIQQGLLISYNNYIQNKTKKVCNVQIENWLEIPFFNHYLKKSLNRLKLNNYDPIKFLGTKLGKHKLSLRFENIHLAMDYLDSQLIFTIHWDRGYPYLSPKWIKHYLFDDILS